VLRVLWLENRKKRGKISETLSHFEGFFMLAVLSVKDKALCNCEIDKRKKATSTHGAHYFRPFGAGASKEVDKVHSPTDPIRPVHPSHKDATKLRLIQTLLRWRAANLKGADNLKLELQPHLKNKSSNYTHSITLITKYKSTSLGLTFYNINTVGLKKEYLI